MEYYERINTERNTFLTKIFEPEENSLEFELTMGIVGELEKSPKILGVDIGPSRPVYHNENSDVFKVIFDEYIAYSVINESYESLGGTEYIGQRIRIYSKSNFLDYVKADTFASPNYPGEFKHYAFISLNHIVNVVSTVEPKIEKIK
ncbi:hypothetical protein [Spongiimicrobium sp. 2-473A-2-J]|uniref:hypothetical protein n=1 Tax=Eudoraea algarum TaxID=3417568 RepID=UPI003D36CAB5